MNPEDRYITVIPRLLGGLAGFVAGGLLAFLVLILVAVVSDKFVGGTSVVPGVLTGASAGFILGVSYLRMAAGICAWLLSA
jgi:hypothetical protein